MAPSKILEGTLVMHLHGYILNMVIYFCKTFKRNRFLNLHILGIKTKLHCLLLQLIWYRQAVAQPLFYRHRYRHLIEDLNMFSGLLSLGHSESRLESAPSHSHS